MSSECLICKAAVTSMNIGIDACRACAVFYRYLREVFSKNHCRRNSRVKWKFECRFNTQTCAQDGRVLECRQCRFDLMKSVLEQANQDIVLPHIKRDFDMDDNDAQHSQSSPDSPPAIVEIPSQIPSLTRMVGNLTVSPTPVLDRILSGYDAMKRVRKTSELCMRPTNNFVHPKDIETNSFNFEPATQTTNMASKQILLSSLYDFASLAFPEFQSLDSMDKLHLISGSSDRVSSLESNFRSAKLFPDDDRVFISYTTTLSITSLDVFLSDCNDNVHKDEIAESLRKNLTENNIICKKAMINSSPTDEEFMIMFALVFWNTDTIADVERLTSIAIAQRSAIMHDWHSYYSSRGITNYADRIGKLFCLMTTNQKVALHITDELELLRLMQ